MEVEVKQLEQTALAWPDRARSITITDQQTYGKATLLLVDIAAVKDRIVAHHKPIKEAAHQAHKAAVAAEKRLLDPLQEAERIIKDAIGTWTDEQERIRLERQKQAEEAQRKADEEARLTLAAEAEAHGAADETVEEILATPVILQKPVVAPTFQPTNGIGTQQRWRAEVTDLKALCRAVAEGRASVECVQPNLTALNAMARALKQTLNVPGVRAVTETTVSVRRSV